MLDKIELGKMREAYADTVIELAKTDPDIVFVSVDCGSHEREFFRKEVKREGNKIRRSRVVPIVLSTPSVRLPF